MRKVISRLAENPLVNLFIALVCMLSGIFEIMHVAEEAGSGRFHAGHGLLAIGFWNAFKAISEALESLDYLAKAAEK
jgi:hypothetical protein